MSDSYGMLGRFVAQPGSGDALAAILLEAAEGVRGDDACLLYVISRAQDDPDSIWVTEAWTSRAAHDASLEDPAARETIGRARTLIASIEDVTHLRPEGGKGL